MTGSAVVLFVLSSHTVLEESEKATVVEEATEPSFNISAMPFLDTECQKPSSFASQ